MKQHHSVLGSGRPGQRCAAGRQIARERRLVRPTCAHVEARPSSGRDDWLCTHAGGVAGVQLGAAASAAANAGWHALQTPCKQRRGRAASGCACGAPPACDQQRRLCARRARATGRCEIEFSLTTSPPGRSEAVFNIYRYQTGIWPKLDSFGSGMVWWY